MLSATLSVGASSPPASEPTDNVCEVNVRWFVACMTHASFNGFSLCWFVACMIHVSFSSVYKSALVRGVYDPCPVQRFSVLCWFVSVYDPCFVQLIQKRVGSWRV